MKIAIIGGGFSGLLAAYKMHNKHNITLYEEHEKIGFPEHCTGLISPSTIQMIGSPARECITNCLHKIRVYGSGIDYFQIEKTNIVCHVDRVCLEKKLFEKISKKITVKLGNRAQLQLPNTIKIKDNQIRYDAIIIAEGNQRLITRRLVKKIPTRTIPGLNALVSLEKPIPEALVVVFNHGISKGFFYWFFPLSKKEAIIGLGTEDGYKIHEKINFILRKHSIEGEIIKYFGGGINTGPPLPQPDKKGIFIIGDAAGMNKPITGGGLYPQARIFSETNKHDCNENISCLKKIIEKMRKKLEKQYQLASILHNPNNQEFIDGVIKKLGTSGIDEEMSKEIDYDEHETLINFFVKHPWRTFTLIPVLSKLRNPWKIFSFLIR